MKQRVIADLEMLEKRQALIPAEDTSQVDISDKQQEYEDQAELYRRANLLRRAVRAKRDMEIPPLNGELKYRKDKKS